MMIGSGSITLILALRLIIKQAVKKSLKHNRFQLLTQLIRLIFKIAQTSKIYKISQKQFTSVISE